MRTRFLFVAAVLCGTALFAAEPSSSDAARVRETHRLTVLTDLSDPYDLSRLIYRVGSGYDGIEYDILKSFAHTLDAEVDLTVAPSFESLFGSLARGEGDVACASITDTPERRRIVDLSDSYFPVRETVVRPKGGTEQSLADFAGKRAITQKGTTWEVECLKVPRVRITYTENQGELFARVADGSADFTVTDSPMAMTYLEKYPGLEIAWSLPQKQNYAFALRKGSDLTPLLNAFLQRLKASGTYYALLGRFYGQKGLAIIQASETEEPPAQKR
jgi:polar amino acid transport system substrate-binding protein